MDNPIAPVLNTELRSIAGPWLSSRLGVPLEVIESLLAQYSPIVLLQVHDYVEFLLPQGFVNGLITHLMTTTLSGTKELTLPDSKTLSSGSESLSRGWPDMV